MVMLAADVLSVVLEFVDTLDFASSHGSTVAAISRKTTTSPPSAAPSSGRGSATRRAAAGYMQDVVRGGAECRHVSRSWRALVEDAIQRAMPAMSSLSLAALLEPGRLRFTLLSCRYNENEGGDAAYDALVLRAEAVAIRLREATTAPAPAPAEGGGGEGGETKRPSSAQSTQSQATAARGAAAGASSSPLQKQDIGGDVTALTITTRGNPRPGVLFSGAACSHDYSSCPSCYRVALKRIVEEILYSPSFAWCSTLLPVHWDLLEGCVGASALLNAIWFSE